MSEVADQSVKLMVGGGIFLPKEGWDAYWKLYRQVLVVEGLRVIRPDGYYFCNVTDQYTGGRVLPRSALMMTALRDCGWELLDVKVWKRMKGDFFQPPFSMIYVFIPPGGTASRPKGADYLAGVWDYPQTTRGALNSYPETMCRHMVNTFTQPGELVLDVFAGCARLLGVAARLGRPAVGYEINEELRDVVAANIDPRLMV